MEKKSLYSHKGYSSDMRVTSEMVYRANARSMAKAGRSRSFDPGRSVNSDGSIIVSARYGGKIYSQHITQQQLRQNFGKAISSYVKKV